MEFKKVIFKYRRDIRSIPRKELIKNLENIRDNYLTALPEIKERFRMQAFSDRGLGELDIRSKLNAYIKKLQKRKLTRKEAKMFQGFLESQVKKVVPANEKSFKRIIKQETAFEWSEYKRMADKQQRPQTKWWELTIENLKDTMKYRPLTESESRTYKEFKALIKAIPSKQLEMLKEELGLSENDIREFLNSNRNVDLSHVTWDSDGLVEFEEEYGLDLPTARLLDYFGYDYAEYGMTGMLVPKA